METEDICVKLWIQSKEWNLTVTGYRLNPVRGTNAPKQATASTVLGLDWYTIGCIDCAKRVVLSRITHKGNREYLYHVLDKRRPIELNAYCSWA